MSLRWWRSSRARATPSETERCGRCCPCTKMRAADTLCGVILHLFVDKPALFAYDKDNTENCVKLAVKRRVRTVCAWQKARRMEPGRPRGAEDGLGAAQVNNEPATGCARYRAKAGFCRLKAASARAQRSKVVPRRFSALVLVRLYPAGRERFLLAGEAAEPKERKIESHERT